ncbi:MAG: CRISPR-associated endonuclease Cas1 [Lachnospiraceae bacterium]|nr:CRISPR-associated endonuclease Cas1 [Lachnospiraceae bacterium]
MSYIYVTENGATISAKENHFVISKGEEQLYIVPIETVDNINIIGRSHKTTPYDVECFNGGIPVFYYS